jgi:hypothetical protein
MQQYKYATEIIDFIPPCTPPSVFEYIGIAFCIALVIGGLWVGITALARYIP